MIHITGVIVWGMLEYYVLMPPDCPKDSNMNATVIARVLDILVSKLKAKGGGFWTTSTFNHQLRQYSPGREKFAFCEFSQQCHCCWMLPQHPGGVFAG